MISFQTEASQERQRKERLGSHGLLQEKIENQFHPLAKGPWIPMTICDKTISTSRACSIRTEVSLGPSFEDVPLWMFLLELTLQMLCSLDTHLGCCCSEYVRWKLTSGEEEFESSSYALLQTSVNYNSSVIHGATCSLGYRCHKRQRYAASVWI